jgi:hypothetical protein
MNIIEAIEKASAFVRDRTGVNGSPEFARLVERPGKPRSWWIVYRAELFFPDEVKSGAVIDGGEYVVRVDDASGDVSVVE